MSRTLNIAGVYLRLICGWVIALAQAPFIPVSQRAHRLTRNLLSPFKTEGISRLTGSITSVNRGENLAGPLSKLPRALDRALALPSGLNAVWLSEIIAVN